MIFSEAKLIITWKWEFYHGQLPYLVEKHWKFPIAHLESLDQKTPIDKSDQRENCGVVLLSCIVLEF